MAFGKPRQTTEEVRCLNCGNTCRDCDLKLKHAGRTVEGDFWNSKCPNCGVYDMANKDLAKLSNEEFYEKQHEVARRRHKQRR